MHVHDGARLKSITKAMSDGSPPLTDLRSSYRRRPNHPLVARSPVWQPRLPLHASHYVVALLIFVTFASFRRREIWELFQGSGFDAEIEFKLAIWLLLGLVALTQWRVIVRHSHLLFRPPLAFYVAYLLIAFLSTMYSVAPALTLFRAAQFAIALALGLSVADRIENWPRLANIFIALNWAFLLVGLTGYPESLNWRVLPSFQEAGFDAFQQPWRFGTPIGHFSQISIVAAMVGITVAARIHDRMTVANVAVLGWLLLTIALTVSRTAAIGFIGGLLFVLASRGILALIVLGGTGLAATILLLLPQAVNAVSDFVERGQSTEDLESLTNRTSIYESAIRSIESHWVLGYGFRASRAMVLDEQPGGSGVGHAHNAVIEATLGLGVMGGIAAVFILLALLIYAIGVLVCERNICLVETKRRGAEFVGLFIPVFAFSMLDSSFSRDFDPFNFCFLAFLIDFTRHHAIVQQSTRRDSVPVSRD